MANNSKTTSILSMAEPPGGHPMPQYARRPAAPARAGRRQVALGGGLLLAVLLPAFISLGLWQWDKAEQKTRLQQELERRGGEPAVAMPTAPADAEALRYRRVSLRGTFDAGRQILLDNQVYREQAGYRVITPLRLAGSQTYVLVDRGWLQAPADHSVLPAAPVPAGELELSGIAVPPPRRFFNLAPQPASGWAPVWQNLDLERFRQTLGEPLQPLLVRLDPAAPGGYVRDWPRPDEGADRHRSYALQWFGFAATSFGIWGYFLVRRP